MQQVQAYPQYLLTTEFRLWTENNYIINHFEKNNNVVA